MYAKARFLSKKSYLCKQNYIQKNLGKRTNNITIFAIDKDGATKTADMEVKDYFIIRDELIPVLEHLGNVLSINSQEIHKIISPASLLRKIDYLCHALSSGKFYPKTIQSAELMLNDIKQSIVRIENLNNKENTDNIRQDILFIRHFVLSLFHRCAEENDSRLTDFNSESFYTNQIQELQTKEKSLRDVLSTLRSENNEYKEKEKELEKVKGQIKQIQAEKDELTKKLDAQNNIQNKISDAFAELKKHISPLKQEEKRLNWMFGVYATLSVCVLFILGYFEFSYLSKWEGANNWIDYLPYYIPVPIVGGLLWAFIFQMNRAQRQLMQIANELYHIDYVEGLLLAINQVSVDVNSASEKISQVLDILIRNYIPASNGLSEKSLDAEISKDNINIHSFINLAKEIKEVIKS